MIEWAKRELKNYLESDDEYDRLMGNCVIELLEKFCDQGHSGFSAPWCVQLFSRLAMHKPIGPLTGEDDEWQKCEGFKTETYQNKRYSAVFKEGKDGKAYNIEGKIFSDDGGETWWTNRNSSVYIDFPYVVPDEPEKVYLNKENTDDEAED